MKPRGSFKRQQAYRDRDRASRLASAQSATGQNLGLVTVQHCHRRFGVVDKRLGFVWAITDFWIVVTVYGSGFLFFTLPTGRIEQKAQPSNGTYWQLDPNELGRMSELQRKQQTNV